MADDLGVQFFTDAKAQHEASAKWHLIVLALLVYFHLALAGPFARQTHELETTLKEHERLSQLEVELKAVVASAVTFTNLVQNEVSKTSGALQDELVGAFAVLDEIIPELVRLELEQAEGEEGERLFRQPAVQQQQQQQQQQQVPQAEAPAMRLPPMDSRLRMRIADSENEDLRELPALKAYIIDAIVEPAIQHANVSWSKVKSTIVEKAKGIHEQIQATIPGNDDAKDQLRQLDETVERLQAVAENLTFVVPEGTAWWGTVGEKGRSIETMLEDMTQSIGQKRNAIEGVVSQAETAAMATKENELRAGEITEELAQLEEQAEELQAQLGTIGEPLKVISLKLSLLAPLLALIIGFGIAALALWRAESLRRMSTAASAVLDAAQDKVIRQWLRSAAGGSPTSLLVWEIASGAVAVAWVVAAWNTTRSLSAPLLPPGAVLGLALAAVAAGWLYHWRRATQALAVSARP
jgi:hypothetical protein